MMRCFDRLLRVAVLVSCLVWLVPLSLAAQDVTEATQPDAPIAVGTGGPSDPQIRSRINNLLAEFDGFETITVSVSEGVVTLRGTVLDNAAQTRLEDLVGRVDGVVALLNETEVNGSLEERLAPAAERIVERTRVVATNAPIFLVGLSAFLIVAVLGWLLTSRLRIWTWLAPNAFIADLYRAVARIAFIVLGVVIGLDILNATALLGAVLGAAGVVGLALGFAVRDTVENFIASVLLSLRQPFRPNDFVDIQGDMGTVARLTSRATILISPQGNHIRIPNATVYKGRIVNYTRDPQRRFDFDLGVDADADQAAALTTAVDALDALPFVLRDPEVAAWVKEVGDSNVILTFTGWVDQSQTHFAKARGEAIRTVKGALEASGFGLPEPIYRVRLDGAGPGVTDPGLAPQPEPRRRAPQPQNYDRLPEASDPEHRDDAFETKAARERADGGEDNLLDARKAAE